MVEDVSPVHGEPGRVQATLPQAIKRGDRILHDQKQIRASREKQK